MSFMSHAKFKNIVNYRPMIGIGAAAIEGVKSRGKMPIKSINKWTIFWSLANFWELRDNFDSAFLVWCFI